MADQPSRWAYTEVDPSGDDYETKAGMAVRHAESLYKQFLLLASGIQMAGPNLTPEAFMRGLHETRFRNPAHPNMPGVVGFTDGGFTMTDDAAELWWSNTDRGYGNDAGTYCYVDGGARHAKGTWPTGGDPFFRGPCDSAG